MAFFFSLYHVNSHEFLALQKEKDQDFCLEKTTTTLNPIFVKSILKNPEEVRKVNNYMSVSSKDVKRDRTPKVNNNF